MLRTQRYVSNELTHFVGARLTERDHQYSLLLQILQDGVLKVPGQSDFRVTHDSSGPVTTIKRSSAIDRGKALSSNDKYRASIVCFADIPIDDLPLHMGKYSQFGLSFGRGFLLGKGANPVFYVARQSSTDVRNPLANDPFNHAKLVELSQSKGNRGHWENFTRAELFDAAEVPLSRLVNAVMVDRPGDPTPPPVNAIVKAFLSDHLFQFLKFFDGDLSEDHPDNYYMEREWRVVGPVDFKLGDVERVLVPRAYSRRLRHDLRSYCGQLTFSD